MALICPCTLCSEVLHSSIARFEPHSQFQTVQINVNVIITLKHSKALASINEMNYTCKTICGYKVCPLRIGGSRVTTTKVCG